MRGRTTIATLTTAELEISLLGPLRARRADQDLALGGPRRRAVLARLAPGDGEAADADDAGASALAAERGISVRIAPHPVPA